MGYNWIGRSTQKDQGCIILKSGNEIYYKGSESERTGGIRFIVNKSIVNRVSGFDSISETIGMLTVKFNKTISLIIIQVYAPTTSEDEELEQFYEHEKIIIHNSNGRLQCQDRAKETT